MTSYYLLEKILKDCQKKLKMCDTIGTIMDSARESLEYTKRLAENIESDVVWRAKAQVGL